MYLDGQDGVYSQVRFILCRNGEDATKAIEAFWREFRAAGNHAGFDVVPLFSHGGRAPRRDLCTKESLAAAVPTAIIPPSSSTERDWIEVREHFGVPLACEIEKPKPAPILPAKTSAKRKAAA